jgi:1-deoxy-D-xylulose-5-phosphate reductoisomerase
MKKKIAILGSTGSIGKSLLGILRKEKNSKIVLLSANKNFRLLINQANEFAVKNIIISDIKIFEKLKKDKRYKNLNIFNNFSCFNKIFKKKIDYTMSGVMGIDGLFPTLKIIKHTKVIAIANKESIICGWNLLNKELKKYNTKFIPVDSEHFSIWFGLLNQIKNHQIKKIYITASGGPFKNRSLKSFKDIKIKDALKHPNWKMGKKISIDSATMVNKIFELIEAKNIFNISYSKLSIMIHPKSYVHAIIEYENGLSQIILHDTDMKIPIFNSLNYPKIKKYEAKQLDINKLNNLELSEANIKRYPSLKIIKYLPNDLSLFETVLVSANDELVNLFLKKKIMFTDISKKLLKIVKDANFTRYKAIKPKKIDDIINLNSYVRSKINH